MFLSILQDCSVTTQQGEHNEKFYPLVSVFIARTEMYEKPNTVLTGGGDKRSNSLRFFCTSWWKTLKIPQVLKCSVLLDSKMRGSTFTVNRPYFCFLSVSIGRYIREIPPRLRQFTSQSLFRGSLMIFPVYDFVGFPVNYWFYTSIFINWLKKCLAE